MTWNFPYLLLLVMTPGWCSLCFLAAAHNMQLILETDLTRTEYRQAVLRTGAAVLSLVGCGALGGFAVAGLTHV